MSQSLTVETQIRIWLIQNISYGNKIANSNFVTMFTDFYRLNKFHVWSFCACIQTDDDYRSICKIMVALGVNRNRFKKVGRWICFKDDEAIVRAKLTNLFSTFVKFSEILDKISQELKIELTAN